MNPAVALASNRLTARAATRRPWMLAALITPWRSTKRQTLRIALAIFVIGCVAAVTCCILLPDARGQALAMIFYAGGVCFVWAFWFSGLLLLARDARMLALPGVLRDTAFCALIYGVFMIAAPALIEGAFGWGMALPAMLSAFAMAAGLTFVLAPRWISVCMGFLPGAYSTAHAAFHVLSPLDPDFLHWSTAASLALFAFVAIRWRHILRDGSTEACGWRTSLLRVFAGRVLGNVLQTSIAGAAFVLMCVSLPLVYLTPTAKLGPVADWIEWALAVAWLVFAVWMACLALRAWRVFDERPHPFLAN